MIAPAGYLPLNEALFCACQAVWPDAPLVPPDEWQDGTIRFANPIPHTVTDEKGGAIAIEWLSDVEIDYGAVVDAIVEAWKLGELILPILYDAETPYLKLQLAQSDLSEPSFPHRKAEDSPNSNPAYIEWWIRSCQCTACRRKRRQEDVDRVRPEALMPVSIVGESLFLHPVISIQWPEHPLRRHNGKVPCIDRKDLERWLPTLKQRLHPKKRIATPKDIRDFSNWVDAIVTKTGYIPTIREMEEFASKRGLSQDWARNERRKLPSNLQRRRGRPRK